MASKSTHSRAKNETLKIKRALLFGVIIVILGISIAACAVYNNQKRRSQATSSSQNTHQPNIKNGGKSLTVTGKMTCLKPRDTSGPQSAICAIGIVGDDGKNYALSAEDPTLTGSIPTGQQVKVTGLFAEKKTQYDTAGTIYVTSLERQ